MSTEHVGFAEVAAALEDQIRRARFRVQVSDENPEYGYAMDDPPYPPDGWTVLSCALPIDEARRRVEELRARPFKYTWMKTGADRFLGFGSAVISYSGCDRYALVMTPAEHASWQFQRLQSGFQSVLDVYETAAEAIIALAEARALGAM